MVLRCVEPARRNAIHGNAMLSPIVRQAHGQLANAPTAGAVGAKSRIARNAGDGTDVNDSPISARHHSTRHASRDEKTSPQIGVENQIPVIPCHVQRRLTDITSSIVNQNNEVTKSVFTLRNKSFNAVQVSDIEFKS